MRSCPFKHIVFLFVLTLHYLSPGAVESQNPMGLTLKSYIGDLDSVGEGKLYFLLWEIYTARLDAPKGEWKNDAPFALTIRYHKAFDGREIAKRTVKEMRGIGCNDAVKLATWYGRLEEILPDVSRNTVIAGVRTEVGATVFLSNGRRLGEVEEEEFTNCFFGIWLDERTSEPELRKKLLGLS